MQRTQNKKEHHRARERYIMKISARNQLKGTITNVAEGAVNGVVTISLGDERVKADITMESIEKLGLTEGKPACAIIKATNVMFATGCY